MEMLLYSVLTFWGIVAAVFLLGVVAITVIGIILIRRKKTAAGVFLTVAGSLGILSSIVFALLVCYLIFIVGKNEGFKQEEFDPSTYKGQLGTISFPFKGESFLSETDISSKSEVRYSSKNGDFRIPAGKHTFDSYEILATDPKGSKWEASSWELSDFENEIAVDDGRNIVLNAGPPFVAKVIAKEKSDGSVSMSIEFKDLKGNKFSVYPAENPSKEDSPLFEVYSASGEKLWSGEFKYG